MRQNKYEYYSVLQGNYAMGWEDISAGTFKEMRKEKRLYEENEGGSYRIINRRELIQK